MVVKGAMMADKPVDLKVIRGEREGMTVRELLQDQLDNNEHLDEYTQCIVMYGDFADRDDFAIGFAWSGSRLSGLLPLIDLVKADILRKMGF